MEVSKAPAPSSNQNEVPICLKRLVRTIVRSFYFREHSLIIDLLVGSIFDVILKGSNYLSLRTFELSQEILLVLQVNIFVSNVIVIL